MKLNWNFLGGGGMQNQRPSVGGVWIFSGTASVSSISSKLNEDYESYLRQTSMPINMKVLCY